MQRYIFKMAACIAVTCATANADVTFDFEGAGIWDGSTALSTHMTSVYGSSVTVTDARVNKNSHSLFTWTGNDSKYIHLAAFTSQGALSGDMEISFDDVPITAVRFDGFVWLDGHFWDLGDLEMRGYTDAYGDRGTPDSSAAVSGDNAPSQMGVTDFSWNPGTWNSFDSGWVEFDEPVSLLVFSNHNIHDIGIDNLQVRAVPAPGAAFLGVVGIGLVGWSRKLFA